MGLLADARRQAFLAETQRQSRRSDREDRQAEFARQAAALKPVLGQFGGDTAKQLGGLLTSGIGQAEALGGQQLGGLLARRQGQEFISETPQVPLTEFQKEQLKLSRRAAGFANLTSTIAARNKIINDMGDDVRTTMKPVTEIVQAGADIENLLNSGTVLGGTAAAIRFAKASDPDSSVREGELGTIIGSLGGLEEAFQNAWNAAVNKPLTERTASDLIKTTRALIAQRALDGLSQLEGFSGLAEAAAVPDDQVAAIFQTARVNLSELVKFAAPAMTEQQLELWRARLSGQ